MEFLKQWELASNPVFDCAACDELAQRAKMTSFTSPIFDSIYERKPIIKRLALSQKYYEDKLMISLLSS